MGKIAAAASAVRGPAHAALTALPSKIFGTLGWIVALAATLFPEKVRPLVERLMTPDQIRIWGWIGLGIFTAYWLLWFWLRPRVEKAKEGPAPAPYPQAAITLAAGRDIEIHKLRVRGGQGAILTTDQFQGDLRVYDVSVTEPTQEDADNTQEFLEVIRRQAGANRTIRLAWMDQAESAFLAMKINLLLQANGFVVEVVGFVTPDRVSIPIRKKITFDGTNLTVDATK